MESNSVMRLLTAAAHGVYPEPDGLVEVMDSPELPFGAVIAFTGRHLVVANVSRSEVLEQLRGTDLGAPMGPSFLTWLGSRTETRAGSLDVLLAAVGEGGESRLPLYRHHGLPEHRRVQRAAVYRGDIRAYSTMDGAGVLILGRGIAGRWEAALEVERDQRNRGLGRQLVAAAKHLVPAGDPIFMQAAPGNAASLRAILAGGFKPIGAEVVLVPEHMRPD